MQGYDLFNSNDRFYNDICSTFNSYNNKDILLNDRKKDFYIQNITLCEDNCVYEDIDIEALKVKCNCDIKTQIISDTTKVKFVPNKIVENFYKIEKYANIKVVVCYKEVFNLNRLKKNYGSYFIIIIGLLFIILMIFVLTNINIKIVKILQKLFFQYNSILRQLNNLKKEKEKKINTKPKVKNIQIIKNVKNILHKKKISNPKKKKNDNNNQLNKINKKKGQNKFSKMKNNHKNIKNFNLSSNYSKDCFSNSYNEELVKISSKENKKTKIKKINTININGEFIFSNKTNNYNYHQKNKQFHNDEIQFTEKIIWKIL